MEFTIGISPCPNDTFIFDAIYNERIDLGSYQFKFIFADVEELNQRAIRGELDITKLSFHAAFKVRKSYILFNSGSALGKGCGPLLISHSPVSTDTGYHELSVAIPGENTTAHILADYACNNFREKKMAVFSEIENLVKEKKVDLGVIIHENRFTYAQKGLLKVVDLGEYWESKTGYPIPLGGICIKRDHLLHASQIDGLIRRSIEYAYSNPQESRVFIKEHAQEMEDDVIKNHINLYVNDFSIELGNEGREAIMHLYEHIGGENYKMDENLFV